MSEVVTGDAVVVEVRVAQMPSRALAVIIDMVVQLGLMIGLFVLISNFAQISDLALFSAVNILMMVLVMVGYPVIFETLSRGRSLGKLALGLRVVSDDGGPERFRQALMRGLAGVMEFWLFSGAPALISSLISQRGKRLGDVFAGTIVISERAPRAGDAPAIPMPPQLAAWAATLELSQLPDEVATAARQYLSRWHDLAPAVQHEMGVRIATQVAAYVSPAAPGGVPPHAYLSAVLAERRRREQVRLARHNPGAYPQDATYPPPAHSPAPQAPQPGYSPAPQAGYSPAPQAGYSPAPQPGYSAAPQPQPVYPQAPQAQPGYPQSAPPPPGPAPAPSYSRPHAQPPTTPEPPRTTPGGFAPPA